ncbi:MAG: UPF0146 family protein [Halorientalis sp.]
MQPSTRDAVAARLARYDSVLEIGIGHSPDVAAALAADGVDVTATDVHERDVPDGVRFVRDDIVPRSERATPGDRYAVDAIYALNLPPELHRPARDVAHAAGADFLFTTLGYDAPAIPVDRESVGPETVYVARERGRRRTTDQG